MLLLTTQPTLPSMRWKQKLGLLPKSTYATVRARLDAIQDQSDVYTFSNAPAARRTIDWADYSTDEALALLITFLKDAQDRKLLG
jgi:hypothetical protein